MNCKHERLEVSKDQDPSALGYVAEMILMDVDVPGIKGKVHICKKCSLLFFEVEDA